MPTPASPRPPAVDLDALRAAVRGRVITPADDDYDAVRAVMYGGFDLRPAALVRVADTDDVAAVVDFARVHGLELAVRSGGHSGAAHGSTDGGLVIDLRDRKAIEIDPEARTAWAETGLTAAEYTAAVGDHGLATGFGDTGSVGLGGITLGGGIGYLVRRFGMTIDSLLEAEVVTADGEIVRASETSHPDLFWALRGGGGNFGVVTRVRLRLHPVAGVVGGMFLLPATPETITGFMAAADAAPEALSAIANVMPAPPMPFLPESMHGRMSIFALMCFAGDEEAAAAAYAPFRALATPLADLIAPIPYAGMFPPEDGDYHPTAVAHTLFMRRIGAREATAILAHLDALDAPMKVAQLRALGGAMARVPSDATAFGFRDRPFMVNVAAFYTDGDDADRDAKQRWVDTFRDLLRGDDRAAYVNFLGDEGAERVRDAYPPATWDRLAAIKRRYDPGNLFRRNQNVPPTGA